MKKVYKNLFASVLPQLVNILSNFILPGLIIAKFGSEVNGLVSTAKNIIAYVSLVGAGIAAAVTQSFYGPVARKDVECIKGMINAANRMFVKYGIIYVVITFAVAVVYPFVISSQIDFLTVALLLIVMSLSGASEFFVAGRCRALLYADQKVYVCNIIQAISLFISLFVAIVMLQIEVNIVLVQLAISLVYVIRAAFLLYYVNRNYPELRDFKSSTAITKTVEKRKDAMIHQLSGLAVSGSQALMLSFIVGLNAASVYSVYNIVFSGLQSICSNVNTAITPYLGKELSLEKNNEARNLYNIIELGFTILVTFIFSVATVLIVPFVRIYTSGADINYIYKDFAIIFSFSSMFYILKLPGTAAINAAGHFAETKSRALIEAVICVVVGIILTIMIGLNGCLIGMLVALGWRCFDTVLYANKYILFRGNKVSMRRMAICIMMTGVSAILSLILDITPSSYLQWVYYACIASVISLVVIAVFLVLFEFDSVKKIIKRCTK